MAYTPQVWNNGDPATPLSGPRLTHIEQGIANAAADADQALADLDGKEATLTAGANITINRTDPNNPIISAAGGGSGSADWGSIGGDISDQLDLVAELAQKADVADLGTAALADVDDFASAAQGALADTAVQPAALDNYATAAQGALADTAVQPGDLAAVATSGSYDDLDDKPTIPSVAGLVPDTRTVNGQPLSDDVVLDAFDLGAITTTDPRLSDQRVPTNESVTQAKVAASLLKTIPVYVQFDGTSWPAHDENPDRVRVFLSQAYEDAPAPTYRNVLDSWLAYHPALAP